MRSDGGVVLALYRAARERPVCAFQEAAITLLRSQVAFDSASWGARYAK
jgi:hypothetical protein